VRRKIRAFHRFVQLGCIAQGLLQLLAIEHRASVWAGFRSWLRTMHPEQPPSELRVAQALRTSLPENLAATAECGDLVKFLARITGLGKAQPAQPPGISRGIESSS